MGSPFPIAISRAMTTPAESGAFGKLELASVTGLQQLQVGFVMAIETQVVAVMSAVAHHDIRVLFRDQEIVLVVEAQRRSFVAFVAGVAIEVRKILLSGHHFSVGNADGVVAGEGRIDQGDLRQGRWLTPEP